MVKILFIQEEAKRNRKRPSRILANIPARHAALTKF
jgi:hypothetical protein